MSVPSLRPADWGAVVDVSLVLGVGASGTWLFWALGLPSPILFGALAGGLTQGLLRSRQWQLPTGALRAGQALIGVTVGSMVSLPALSGMGRELPEILLVTLGTLVLSGLAGFVLALRRDVSRVTGVFGLIAGGASGIVALAHDLGADDRVVAVVQYLRVLLVLAAMPVIATVVFSPATGVDSLAPAASAEGLSLVYVAAAAAVGLGLAGLLRVPTAYLLGPLLLAVLLGATDWFAGAGVPTWLQWVGFALVGTQVGLRFTRESLTAITRMLPVVLLLIALLIAGCAGLGVLLAATTAADPLTGYLATTPGGLFAVLALAADSGSDVTYVTTVQLFRLLVILALAPVLARWLRRA